MTMAADVLVLGAGVAGCATAYFLAREGLSVTVLEREAIGACASGYALGLLNPTNDPGPSSPLQGASFRMHQRLLPRLQEEVGMDLQARWMPHLELSLSEDDLPVRKAEMARWSEMEGFSARWLEPEEALRLEPRLAPTLRGAVLLEDVVLLDSYRLTLALARAAEANGARFIQQEAVGLERTGDRVSAATLRDGRVPCGAVVVATGPWAGGAGAWLSQPVPVRPQKGEIIHLQGMELEGGYHIHGEHLGSSCSVVQKGDGLTWVAATRSENGFDDQVSPEARDLLIQRGLSLAPAIGDLPLVRQTACLRPLTPDELPILGKAPGWANAYLALGAGGKGVLLAPAVGHVIRDLVVEGETSLPIGPLRPDRFHA